MALAEAGSDTMSQLMFSRRAVQHAIDRLGSTLGVPELANLVSA
jgi:hypothetical protein